MEKRDGKFRAFIFVWAFTMLGIYMLFILDALPKEDVFPTAIFLAICGWMIKYGMGEGTKTEENPDKM